MKNAARPGSVWTVESRLAILASAILEGTPIDWRSVDSTGDPRDKAIVKLAR